MTSGRHSISMSGSGRLNLRWLRTLGNFSMAAFIPVSRSCPWRVCSDRMSAIAVRIAVGGRLMYPICWKPSPWTAFPKHTGKFPICRSSGNSRRDPQGGRHILDSTMPTIKPIRTLGKLRSILVATVAAALMPYSPSGKLAITTLCAPILPKV